MNIKIGQMEFAHLDLVVELDNRCFSIPWSRKMFMDELLNGHAKYYVAVEENGAITGYIGLHHVLDVAYITNLAVAPDFRRQGIGKALLTKALETCRSMDISSVTLEVRESNKIAISLYRRFGFSAVGKRINYYRNPIEDALIMLLEI